MGVERSSLVNDTLHQCFRVMIGIGILHQCFSSENDPPPKISGRSFTKTLVKDSSPIFLVGIGRRKMRP